MLSVSKHVSNDFNLGLCYDGLDLSEPLANGNNTQDTIKKNWAW